ncbi:MAG: tRNA-intron lyase [Nanoarchaeota archaeon]|nr:tRNA-intron lyase [Nanoarchaeota archaeon]
MVIKAELVNDKIYIFDEPEAQRLYNTGWYGNISQRGLELTLIEAASLYEKEKLEIYEKNKKITFLKFIKHANDLDNRFNVKYQVYRDLRERGLPVRTGLKFGCDFRVYERGVKPMKKGPKQEQEHTKWIVFAVSENYTQSFQELSRSVRLAHNIRANMLWAVVDGDNNVTYYSVIFTRL